METEGNPNGKYQLQLQYCGGWGYKKHVLKVRREVEKKHPKDFEYVFIKDKGVTGNLEIHLLAKVDGAVIGEKQLVHSKRTEQQGYPHNDWEGFH